MPIDNEFDIEDWYYEVTDNNPSTERYSTARAQYITIAGDGDYSTWLGNNNIPTIMPTENELFQRLADEFPAGLPAGTSSFLDEDARFLRRTKNRIINPTFAINQRNYTGGSNLDSGDYGPDRWKSEANGTQISFGVEGLPISLNNGGIVSQVIEDQYTGEFQTTDITVALHAPTQDFLVTLSRSNGTSATQKTISAGGGIKTATWNSGETGSFTGDIKIEIENDSGSSGSFRQVILVLGDEAPPVLSVDLIAERQKCLRYYIAPFRIGQGGGYANAANVTERAAIMLNFPVVMRTTPTLVGWNYISGGNVTETTVPYTFGISQYGAKVSMKATAAGSTFWNADAGWDAEYT